MGACQGRKEERRSSGSMSIGMVRRVNEALFGGSLVESRGVGEDVSMASGRESRISDGTKALGQCILTCIFIKLPSSAVAFAYEPPVSGIGHSLAPNI